MCWVLYEHICMYWWDITREWIFFKYYGFSCLSFALKKSLLNFSHDVLRKGIMNTLQNYCGETLSWELPIFLLMKFYDFLCSFFLAKIWKYHDINLSILQRLYTCTESFSKDLFWNILVVGTLRNSFETLIRQVVNRIMKL